MPFPSKISLLVDTKQISVVSKSEKQKKKTKQNKTKLFSHLFSIFHLPFYNFLLLFSIGPFSCVSLFPVGQQKFPSEKPRGHSTPPCPLAVVPLIQTWQVKNFDNLQKGLHTLSNYCKDWDLIVYK